MRSTWTPSAHYDLASVAPMLSFINLMAYDYHGGWVSLTPWQGQTGRCNVVAVARRVCVAWGCIVPWTTGWLTAVVRCLSQILSSQVGSL